MIWTRKLCGTVYFTYNVCLVKYTKQLIYSTAVPYGYRIEEVIKSYWKVLLLIICHLVTLLLLCYPSCFCYGCCCHSSSSLFSIIFLFLLLLTSRLQPIYAGLSLPRIQIRNCSAIIRIASHVIWGLLDHHRSLL